MLREIRRSPALHGWPLWMLLGLNVGAAFSGLLSWNANARGETVSGSAVLLVAWSAAAVYLLFGAVRARCSPHQLALPLSARRLWTAHVLAMGIMSVALAGLTLGLTHVLAARRAGAESVDLAALLAHVAAWVMLAVVLLQSYRASLARLPFTWGYALWTLAVLIAVPALLLLVRPFGAVTALVPLALAVGLACAVAARMPAAFSVAPREAVARRARARARRPAGAAEAAPSRWVVVKGVTLGVSAGAKEFLSLPFVLLMATTTGGILGLIGEDATDLRYLYLPLVVFMLFAGIGPRLGRLQCLDPLPLPRRALFAVLVLPYLLLFCAGYGLGALGNGIHERRAELVNYCAVGDTHVVVTPLRTRKIAWDGHVPAVSAPGGESHVPPSVPLWRGSRAVLYSPYRVPVGASREFVAWQLSRAARDVYGAEVPPGEIFDRYLAAGPGSEGAACEMLTLRADHPGLRPRGGGPMFPVLFAMIGVPWLLLAGLLLRAYRPGIRVGLRQAIFWGLAGVGIAIILGFVVGIVTRLWRPWMLRALAEIPVAGMADSPMAVLATWVVAVLLLAAAYWLAQSQFVRMEIPAKPTKYTLVDWLGDEP